MAAGHIPVKLLCRFYDPAEGGIYWDGTDIRDLDPASLRARLAAVFQDYMEYDMTAAENIGLGDLAGMHDRDRVCDRVLADRSRIGYIRVGDIVVLEPGRPRPVLATRTTRPSTAEPAYWMIKRVVAVPGDPVPPGSVPKRLAPPGAVVPDGKLVVIGDNAAASSDSRQLGYFHIERVLGVARRR